MGNDNNLIALALGFIIAAACFNAFGSFTTKLTSAANRSVFEQIRVVLVWAFFLFYQGVGHETFHVQKLLGFMLIVLGVLFFNKILVIVDCYKVKFMPTISNGDNITVAKSPNHSELEFQQQQQ